MTSTTTAIGVILAVLSALVATVAALVKHRGCVQAAPVDIRRPLRTARALWSHPWFATGMVLGAGAWGLHVAAIALAPLTIVQVALTAGMVMLALVAERLFAVPVGSRQRLGLLLAALGLGLLAVTMPAVDGSSHAFTRTSMATFELVLLAVGLVLLLGPRVGVPERHHGLSCAIAAGLLLGVCNVAVKALSGVAEHDGPLGVLSSPWLLAAGAGSFLAFFASARSLQVGHAVEVIAVTGTAANIAGIAGGILVFGDPLPGTAIGITVQLAALCMVVGAATLMPTPVARRPSAVA